MKNIALPFLTLMLCLFTAASATAVPTAPCSLDNHTVNTVTDKRTGAGSDKKATASLIKQVRRAPGIEVIYQSSYKGHVRPGGMAMKIVGTEVALSGVRPEGAPELGDDVLRTSDYQDWEAGVSKRLARLPGGRVINTVNPFKRDEGFVKEISDLTAEQTTVLGLPCRVWRFSVNSNTIDVWWTDVLTRTTPDGEVRYCGTPQLPNGCAPSGVVLKVVRNGDMVQEAISITPLKETERLFPASWGDEMEAYEYQYECNHCYDINVRVFDQQAVKFSGDKLDDPKTLRDGEMYRCGGGTIILKRVKLPRNARGRSIFATITQYSEGDAYDRTGSVFVIPTGKEKSFLDAIHDQKSVPAFRSGDVDYHGLVSTPAYDAPVELMRFFTGFGVRQFNYNRVPGQTWVDSVSYKMNVTPLADHLEGDVWIGAYIGNWDANGHKISLSLTYYPGDDDHPHGVRRSMPLFNSVNYLEQDGQPYPIFMGKDDLVSHFHLDRPVKKACLYYLTSGHGGWGGGDEFNQKINTISLDGHKVIDFIPWRDDCMTYRNNSPCSGNFSNGLSSSDLSRSNWCPGTVTNPEYIYLGDLEAGDHSISVHIPQGAPEGGSNSYWCLSGTLLYFE